WRKQAKYFLNQINVVKKVWPAAKSEFGKPFDELCQILGDHHDLQVLRQKIEREPDRFGGTGPAADMKRRIDRSSAALFDRALLLGRMIYRDGPKRPTRRIRRFQSYSK